MKPKYAWLAATTLIALGITLWLSRLDQAAAHCDTMDGPVVRAAKAAIAKGDLTPVLKWVQPEGETEVRAAFKQTLAARTASPAARQVADRYFFETLVRVHRAGEGEPFTGIRDAGAETDPAIIEADRALESGSPEKLVKLITNKIANGIRSRFAETAAKRRHADESVSAGREYVAEYVEFIHYAERVNSAAADQAAAHGSEADAHKHK